MSVAGGRLEPEAVRTMFDRIARDLDSAQYPLPAGITTRAFGEAVPSWAAHKSRRIVTHAEMDPVHRADPWPHGCAHIAKLAP